MRDDSFVCVICGFHVAPLGYTARDHCPVCLHSKHVDINPGDRRHSCQGILVPIGVENHRKGYKIIYKCASCATIKKNIAAQDDDFTKILEIAANFQKWD